jgi:hypothetical protein
MMQSKDRRSLLRTRRDKDRSEAEFSLFSSAAWSPSVSPLRSYIGSAIGDQRDRRKRDKSGSRRGFATMRSREIALPDRVQAS